MKKKNLKIVTNKMEWLRSLGKGEERSGYFESPKDCFSMSVLIARWNNTESFEKGFKIRAHYNYKDCNVTIYTTQL